MTEPKSEFLLWPAAESPAAKLRHLCAWALGSGRPVALWRAPGGAHARLLVSRSVVAAYTGLPPALDAAAPAGFAFFPFRDSDHNPALFLPADLSFDLAEPDEVWVAGSLAEELKSWLYANEVSETGATPLPWHQSQQPAPPPPPKRSTKPWCGPA
jgi:isochorismate synthase